MVVGLPLPFGLRTALPPTVVDWLILPLMLVESKQRGKLSNQISSSLTFSIAGARQRDGHKHNAMAKGR